MKNKWLVKTIAFTVIVLFISSGVVSAFNVDNESKSLNNGNWFYVGGSGEGNYSKIQDAIDNASNGDTIFVYDDLSPYLENITINKSIILTGENRDNTIIEGGKDTFVIIVTSNNVNIYNFTIKNNENSSDILILNSQGCNIIDNYIVSNNRNIEIENSLNITIQENNIESKWRYSGPPSWAPCILIRYSNHNIITNNTIHHISKSFSGIDISESYENVIIGNVFYNNSEGIFCYNCGNNSIIKNIIHSSGHGILLHASTNISITDNYITGNGDGIHLEYKSNQNHIFNNSIESNNEHGIKFDDRCEKNRLWMNIIKENNNGFFINNECNNNTIFWNSFINNKNQSYDDCDNNWNNPYPGSGNYWSDYNGKDDYHGYDQDIIGPDGIGDTPYNISHDLNQDKYPLMYPFGWPFQPIYLGISEFYFEKYIGEYGVHGFGVISAKYLYVNSSLDDLPLRIVFYFTVEMNYTTLFPFALSPLIALGLQILNYSDYSWNALKLKHQGYWIWNENVTQEIIVHPKDFKKGDELQLYVNISSIHVPFLKSPGNTKSLEYILRIIYNTPVIKKLLLYNWALPFLAPYNMMFHAIHPSIFIRFQ